MKNIAILSGWLGQHDESVPAWHKYARLDGVPRDEAVEAEALAQMLDAKLRDDEVDAVTVTFTVPDVEKLMESLLSDSRVSRMPVDPSELAGEGQPPPKAAFWLLDKPVPASGEDLQREQVPNVLGELYVYGRQTDRDARVEFGMVRDDAFDSRKAALADLCGDLIDKEADEVVDGSLPKVSAALTWRWRLPDTTSPDKRRELIAEQRRDVMLKRWPELELKALGGKTPRQAAADPQQRIPILAAILLLELANEQNENDFDFNELRRELNLPTRDPLDTTDIDPMRISIIQVPLLRIDELSDEDLLVLYRRVVLKYATTAIRVLAAEVLRRESLDETVDKDEAYELMIRTARDSIDALKYVEAAQKAAVDGGTSPARWLLSELSIRLSRGEGAECERLARTLQTRHGNEPGVAQALYELLVSAGVISPDGAAAAPQSQAVASEEPAADQPASKIWTPDDAQPADSGEQKSKLWVPGMD